MQIIASHVIKIHASAGAASAGPRVTKDDNWLKRSVLSEVFITTESFFVHHNQSKVF